MGEGRTEGYECGQRDYKQNRCLAYVDAQGRLVWCTNADVGAPETNRDQWGRDYHEGWQSVAQGDTLPPEDERPTLIP